MADAYSIFVICDGKLGHENQSIGLAEAMGRLRAVEIYRVPLDMKKSFWTRLREALSTAKNLPRPDFVIAAGHATHPAALCIARRYAARCVSLMRPSLPSSWFFRCICPEHDFFGKKVPAHVLLSKGALNRVRPTSGQREGNFFLIGGPSKIHGWDGPSLIEQIRTLCQVGSWQIADSRRTPSDFLSSLQKELPDLELCRHQETPSGWLAEKLACAARVWVTEDSVSMIYEALSGGAKVGILKMPRLRAKARVIQGLELLREQGYFDDSATPQLLAEADRCAKILLDDCDKQKPCKDRSKPAK